MPIYKGNTQIVGIYKGNTEIIKRYKGSSLIYEAFRWLPYSFEYLYNSLIPTTLNNKTVKDKIRLNKIYANGVIENQLAIVPTIQTQTLNGITLTNSGDGLITIQGTATADTIFTLEGNLSRNVPLGHKVFITNFENPSNDMYLYDAYESNLTSALFNSSRGYIKAKEGSTTTISPRIWIANGTVISTPQTTKVMYIDLTLREGTGNEPTTTSDPRIQAILNGGYIAYNTGSYKGTDISEFVSEPYNIWDEQVRYGYYSGDGAFHEHTTIHRICNANLIPVLPNTTYYGNDKYLCFRYEYDKDGNFLREASTFRTNFTTSSDCYYINFSTTTNVDTYLNDISISLVNNGYKPYRAPTTLTFKYQGNGALQAHDTLEVTKTEWVFTKNIGSVDLGDLSVDTYNSSTKVVSFRLSHTETTYSSPMNALCNKYNCVSDSNFDSNDKCFASSNANYFRLKDSSFTATTNAEIKTEVTGTYLYYELATSQVIRIPRKHLAVVDLGTLTWTGGNQYGETNSDTLGGIIKPIATGNTIFNGYCFRYENVSANTLYHSTTKDKMICQWQESVATGGRLTMLDTNFKGKTAQEIQALLSGILLFYETEDEVADIDNTMQVEVGGTITSDSDVLPNLDALIKCK